MDRMEEYKDLMDELENTPPALEFTVQRARARARARARKRSVRRLFGVPAASLAGVFAAFVLLVNLSTPFALACGSIPLLKDITAAVAFSPSLKAAVQHDYVQPIGLTQTENGITMTVDYVIVDNKQINVFFTTESSTTTRFSVIPSISSLEGEKLEGYSISNSGIENDALQKIVIDFMDTDVPQGMHITCDLIPLENEYNDAPVCDDGSQPEYVRPNPVATFTFDLHFDSSYTDAGETFAMNRWLSIDGQHVLVKDVAIYPTHIRLNLVDDETNTAWLQSLDFYLEDEQGNKYEKISNGIVATGSQDSHFMAGHRLESSYFGDAKHLTVHIVGVTWLEKDMEYVTVDLKNGTTDTLPDWMRLDSMKRIDSNGIELIFSSTYLAENHYHALLRWDYLDEAGEEHSFNGMSSTDVDQNPERFEARVVLEDYKYDTVRLGLSSSRMVELDTPVEIIVK